MNFVCINGKILPSSEHIFTVQNRCFKWGDGLFETMKVYREKILLEELHFERLFISLKVLLIQNNLRQDVLVEDIIRLCHKNNCSELARVRLSVYRDEMNHARYSVEAIPLNEEVMTWNSKGLTLSLYPFARKSTDVFSNLKSANYLPYLMASMYAQQNSWDDVLVLNSNNKIADTSRANLFIVRQEELFTPALHQGCINGVMRRYLLDHCKKKGIVVHQGEIDEAKLFEADEVFLTNAIQGIRWVRQFKDREYGSVKTFALYQQMLSAF